ncbi:MAG: protein kinase, partial [Anaerolineales bacterium]|nr:protein kinase [Anaerolineales bacterium]
MNSEPNQATDRYQFIDKIGAGGMGTVYSAWDREIEREVALKWLPAYFSADQAFVERFKREARVIARLEHPHIVPIYDVGEYEGRPFIIMRLLNGGTLRERLARPEFNLLAFIGAMEDVADALTAAHRRNIVHRDIKPGNILFDESGSAFLSDFGIAKVLDAATQLTGSGLIGTPAYMSPEQFVGHGIDGRSDQYSLAVVVFETLTGKLPFKGNTAQMMYKHLNAAPPEIDLEENPVPAGLNQVLQKGLAKEPENRYPTVKGFVAALRAAIEADSKAMTAPLPLVAGIIAATPVKPPTAPTELDTPSTPQMVQLRTDYRQGLEAMSKEDWAVALAAFNRVLAVDQNYGNAQTLQAQAQTNLEHTAATTAAKAAAVAAAAAQAVDKTTVEPPSAPIPAVDQTTIEPATPAVLDNNKTTVEPPITAAVFASTANVAETPAPAVPPPTAAATAEKKRPVGIIAAVALILLLLCAVGAFGVSRMMAGTKDTAVTDTTKTTDDSATFAGASAGEGADEPTATTAPSDTPQAEDKTAVVAEATNTPAPSPTDEPTATAELPTETAEPLPPQVRVVVASANLRRGPGVAYATQGAIFEGEIANVIASNKDRSWYNILLENGTKAWIAASVIESVEGSLLDNVEIALTIPPVPTKRATAVPATNTPILIVTATPSFVT